MNISILPSSSGRPLFIDFETYTDGDIDFKKELIFLMIDNIRELQRSSHEAHTKNSFEVFQVVRHKIKPTLSMLNDKVLLDTIEELREQFQDSSARRDHISVLNVICSEIIKSLEKEASCR